MSAVSTGAGLVMANKAAKDAKAQNNANLAAQKEAQDQNYNMWFMSKYGVDPTTLTPQQRQNLPIHMPMRDAYVGQWGNVQNFTGSPRSRPLPAGFRTRSGNTPTPQSTTQASPLVAFA